MGKYNVNRVMAVQEEAGMNTNQRMDSYARQMGQRPLTAAQRRRYLKKAGREQGAVIERDDGMGCAPALRGYRTLLGFER